MDTETIVLIIALVIVGAIFILLEYNRNHNIDTTNIGGKELEGFDSQNELNKEAIQNIASIYNKQNLTVSNLTATASIKTNDLTAASINVTKLNILPRGVIVSWNGDKAPEGWLLCDGKNGTPDLRGRFVYGYGANRGTAIGATGGVETVTLTEKQMPAHSHRIVTNGDDGGYCNRNNNVPCRLQSTDRLTNDRIDYTSGYLMTQASGGNQSHENMPPYFVLAYIMKA